MEKHTNENESLWKKEKEQTKTEGMIHHKRTPSRSISMDSLKKPPITPNSTPNFERKNTIKHIIHSLAFEDLSQLPGFAGTVSAHFSMVISLENKLKNTFNYIVINKETIATLRLIENTHAIASLKYQTIQLAKQLIDDYINPAYHLAQRKQTITLENHKLNLQNTAELVIHLTSINTVSKKILKKFPLSKANIFHFSSLFNRDKIKPVTIQSLVYKYLPKELSEYILDVEAYNALLERIIELNKKARQEDDNAQASAKLFDDELLKYDFSITGYISLYELIKCFIEYLKGKYAINTDNCLKIIPIMLELEESLFKAIYNVCLDKTQQNSKLTKLHSHVDQEKATLYFKKYDPSINMLCFNLEKIFDLSHVKNDEQLLNKLNSFVYELLPEEQLQELSRAIDSWFEAMEQLPKIAELTSNVSSQLIETDEFCHKKLEY